MSGGEERQGLRRPPPCERIARHAEKIANASLVKLPTLPAERSRPYIKKGACQSGFVGISEQSRIPDGTESVKDAQHAAIARVENEIQCIPSMRRRCRHGCGLARCWLVQMRCAKCQPPAGRLRFQACHAMFPPESSVLRFADLGPAEGTGFDRRCNESSIMETDAYQFIGETGYCPRWEQGSGRWVFQRTLIITGQRLGEIAQLRAMEVAVSGQVVVWSPPRRFPIVGALPLEVERERHQALREFHRWRLVCYGNRCRAKRPGSGSNGMAARSVIRESGLHPDKWLLVCPYCGASVGPDITCMTGELLIHRWESVGRPRLEYPVAGAGIQSLGNIVDLAEWIGCSEPSQFELAYLGQQMWPDIASMLTAMTESSTRISPRWGAG